MGGSMPIAGAIGDDMVTSKVHRIVNFDAAQSWLCRRLTGALDV